MSQTKIGQVCENCECSPRQELLPRDTDNSYQPSDGGGQMDVVLF